MDTDEQILDYLSSKENLAFALEISKLTERIRERIHRQFWELAEESLKQKAEELPDFDEHWKIEHDSATVLANWHTISLTQKSPPSPLHLSVCLQQERAAGQYKLYTGYLWSKKTRNIPPHPSLDKLKTAAAEENVNKPQEPWLLTWGYSPWEIQSDKFLLRFVDEPKAILADTVDVMWRLFENQRDVLLEANQAIAEVFDRGEGEKLLQ